MSPQAVTLFDLLPTLSRAQYQRYLNDLQTRKFHLATFPSVLCKQRARSPTSSPRGTQTPSEKSTLRDLATGDTNLGSQNRLRPGSSESNHSSEHDSETRQQSWPWGEALSDADLCVQVEMQLAPSSGAPGRLQSAIVGNRKTLIKEGPAEATSVLVTFCHVPELRNLIKTVSELRRAVRQTTALIPDLLPTQEKARVSPLSFIRAIETGY